MSSVEVLETPVKSENDKKSYRVIRLENGLKALLISDPSKTDSLPDHSTDDAKSESAITDEDKVNEVDNKLAACAVCVDVGSFSDPPDVQGMAHFLGVNYIFPKFKPFFNKIFTFVFVFFRTFNFSGLRKISK